MRTRIHRETDGSYTACILALCQRPDDVPLILIADCVSRRQAQSEARRILRAIPQGEQDALDHEEVP